MGSMVRTVKKARFGGSLFFKAALAPALFVAALVLAQPAHAQMKTLEPGLELGRYRIFESYYPNLTVLRADPALFELALLSAREKEMEPTTPRTWAELYNLVACINASMYQEDILTSTAYMRNFKTINNAKIHPSYGAFLVFNPKEDSLPAVQMVDRRTDANWHRVIEDYHTVIQNYRMIGQSGPVGWQENGPKHTVAGVCIDTKGRVLFIYCDTPASVRDISHAIMELALDIRSMAYVEGGSKASLFIKSPAGAISLGGAQYRPIPNVLGLVRLAPR
ncbi:MAG: phosphodiester glycosidase family protein [Desulfatibacillaceae bacterium]|nr:phosphodiester glycosidase family protein [Desulfatibacillaceae bacterium]